MPGIIRQFPKIRAEGARFLAVEDVEDALARFDATCRTATYRLALRLQFLTGARLVEIRYATWDEIDMDAATWTVPGDKMKSGRKHVVPLSAPALAVLRQALKLRRNGQIFPARQGGRFDDSALRKAMKRAEIDATPHGGRTTLRQWIARQRDVSWAAGELSLAHAIAGTAGHYFQDETLLDERREIMARYAVALGI